MNQSLIVRGAPQEYECQVGTWERLEEQLNRRDLSRVLILHGTASWKAAKPYFPSLMNIDAQFINYGGECTYERVAELTQYLEGQKLEAIVAVGGGKIADLGKAVADQCKIPIIILPTLAATCAAYTPLSVMYTADGVMNGFEFFSSSNALVLVEPRVILHSPTELMVAGIGDTIAKWYESDAIISQLQVKPVEVQVATFAARKCRDLLLQDSQAAIEAMEKKELNQAFLNVVETNILLAGMVGGFADEYGRSAGAHSIHDALTMIPASHQQLHGNKVAYGVLVQLVIEDKWTEIEQLLPFYRRLGLPSSLKDMNLILTEADYERVAERAAQPHEYIHFMKETINPAIVKQAMVELEAAMADQ